MFLYPIYLQPSYLKTIIHTSFVVSGMQFEKKKAETNLMASHFEFGQKILREPLVKTTNTIMKNL